MATIARSRWSPVTSPSAGPPPRPFLKWVGGKTQLLGQLAPLMPVTFERYFEPFVGGAAVFFELRSRSTNRAKHAFLSDVNEELVNAYRQVRDNVERVIGALRDHVYTSEHYYRVRAEEPEDPVERAARTIFLNKTGYNGLYRVNRSGRFNVPFGRFTNPAICDAENLRACSRALQRVSIKRQDFTKVTSRAKEGDFVYFDPPYVPVSATSDFTAYIPGGFGDAEQERLRDVVRELDAVGAYVMLSNSDTPRVRELYQGFDVQTVHATRSVNSNAARRGKLTEVVVRNYTHHPGTASP